MQWFRMYSETVNDTKIKRIARINRSNRATVIGVWTIILSMASESPDRGTLLLADDIPVMCEDIADTAGMTVDEVEAMLASMVKLGMLELTDETFAVNNWDKRQFKSDSSNARVKRYRKRQAKSGSNDTVTETKRYTTVTVTPPEADTDTEADTEAEKQQQQASIYSKHSRTNGHDNAAAAALIEFGISGIKREEILKSGVSAENVRGWCNYAKSQKRLENPIGYAIRQMLDGKPPPELPPQPVAIFDDNIVE